MTMPDGSTSGLEEHGATRRRMTWHFAEMVAAMLVGMMVLGMVVRMSLTVVGQADLLDRLEAQVVVMTLTMAIGMTAWMRYRRHGWAGIVEMNLAMALSFVVLLVPYWAGMLPEAAVMAVGHVLMLPAMALVMLRRRAEYAHAHAPVDGGQLR